MSEDTDRISQWIAEIEALKQQVRDLKHDRDEAYTSADRWRERYTLEAQQRREDGQTHQGEVDRLQRDLARLQGDASDRDGSSPMAGMAEGSPEANWISFPEAIAECKRLQGLIAQLQEDLQAERDAHEQTRRSLTTALGDAIDVLNQQRQPDA